MPGHKYSLLLSEVPLALGWRVWQRRDHDGVRDLLLHGPSTSLPRCCRLLLCRCWLVAGATSTSARQYTGTNAYRRSLMSLVNGFLFRVVVGRERPEDGDLLPRGSRFDRLGATLEEVERLATLLYQDEKGVSESGTTNHDEQIMTDKS